MHPIAYDNLTSKFAAIGLAKVASNSFVRSRLMPHPTPTRKLHLTKCFCSYGHNLKAPSSLSVTALFLEVLITLHQCPPDDAVLGTRRIRFSRAARARPISIVVLTLLLVMLGALSLGLRFALDRSRPVALSAIYVVAWVVVINMMIDYDRSQTGFVKISLAPLQRQLQFMQRSQ